MVGIQRSGRVGTLTCLTHDHKDLQDWDLWDCKALSHWGYRRFERAVERIGNWVMESSLEVVGAFLNQWGFVMEAERPQEQEVALHGGNHEAVPLQQG